MLRSILPPALALFFALFAATPAWPCSPLVPSLHGPTAPGGGRTDVPRNSRFVIHSPLPAGNAQVFLETADEEPLPVSFLPVGNLVIVDLPELLPDTEYTLSFEMPDDGFGEVARDPVSFTTGDFFDDEPPVFESEPGAVEVRYDPSLPTPMDSCGFAASPERWTVYVPAPEVSDDVAVAGYRLLEVDERGGVIERSATFAGAGDDDLVYDIRHEGGEVTYVVEAFDLAGNAVTSAPFTVSLFAGGGCSATAVTSARAPAAALLLLPLLGALRRRRR